jgi:hypothetical protein
VVSCSYPCTMNCVALTWFHILWERLID